MLEPNRTCRGCHAPVAFVPSAVSRAIMVLDPEPSADGNIVVRDGVAVVLHKIDLFEPATAEPRYLDHHATCVNVAQFRRTPRKKGA